MLEEVFVLISLVEMFRLLLLFDTKPMSKKTKMTTMMVMLINMLFWFLVVKMAMISMKMIR